LTNQFVRYITGNVENPVEFADRVNFLFGERLARARRARRVSQENLGKRVNLSRTTIANLERGAQNVQLYQLFALARALDADPLELIPDRQELQESKMDDVTAILEALRAEILKSSGGAS
jgi:transcriptional regulator with XRE-family HTH domain